MLVILPVGRDDGVAGASWLGFVQGVLHGACYLEPFGAQEIAHRAWLLVALLSDAASRMALLFRQVIRCLTSCFKLSGPGSTDVGVAPGAGLLAGMLSRSGSVVLPCFCKRCVGLDWAAGESEIEQEREGERERGDNARDEQMMSEIDEETT